MQLQYWNKPTGFLSLFKLGLRALDISLYELMLRDINNWIKDRYKIQSHDLNITLVQPKDFIFESVEFSKCKNGTEYGLTQYDMYNPTEMRGLFQEIMQFMPE